MNNFLSNKTIYKFIYTIFYLGYLLNEKILKNSNKNNYFADKFLNFNNKRIEKIYFLKKVKKIAILLPHCIRNYDCLYKVTSNIENCRKCGKCKIQEILNLKEKYKLDIKIATGGTLARLFIKEKKPRLIIAVACKRDLISGIYDSLPSKVYGVYNKIRKNPCINTDVDIKFVEKIVRKFSEESDKNVVVK